MLASAEQPGSYLEISMKLLDLERKLLNCGKENSANGSYIFAVEKEIKEMMTRQDVAPRRSQDEINADIEKYRAELTEIRVGRSIMSGFAMRLRLSDELDILSITPEKRRLENLNRMIAILTDELKRN